MRQRSLVLVVLAALALAAPAGEAAGAGKGDRASPARLKAFGSCATFTRYARRNGVRLVRAQTPVGRVPSVPLPDMPTSGGGEGGGQGGAGEDGAAAPQTGGPVPLAGGGEPGSRTNVQEEGVDEPDIVKTRGGTLLVLLDNRLHTLDATVSPPRLLDTLTLPGYGGQLMVHGDRALVMSSGGGFGGPGPVPLAVAAAVPVSEWSARSVLTEVDTSDPAALRVARTLDVEGSVVSSRLTGPTARVVVASYPRALEMPPLPGATETGEVRERWTRSVRRARSTRWRPSSILRSRRTGRRVQRPLVECRRVRRARYFSGLEMLTVLTIDMEKGLPAVDTDTVMSDAQTVYASPTGLYVGTERWLGVDPTLREVREDSYTAIHKFDASQRGQTTYRASGEVPGYLLNQWSLSEHEGILRVATSTRPAWWGGGGGGNSQSAVRTFDERGGRLVELGKVGGLGPGEQIFAVRFMGDVGYVVTFRQTDPLYAIDLASPSQPRLLGELKVPGYSAYLPPIGDDLLLGVGQDADAQGGTRGVQVSLFDVRDLRDPRRLDQRVLGPQYSQSEIENDHHAFLWWEPERLAMIPVIGYDQDFTDEGSRFEVFGLRVDRANGIQPAGTVTHPGLSDWPGIVRSVVAGGRMLTVSAAGVMSSAMPGLGDGQFTPFPPLATER